MNSQPFQNLTDPAGMNNRADIIITPGRNLLSAVLINFFFEYILIMFKAGLNLRKSSMSYGIFLAVTCPQPSI
jgi:hypothetical protein